MTHTPPLPAGWSRVTLGDLGLWTCGGTPPRAMEDCFGGDIPWVKTGDLADGPVLEVEEHLTERGLQSCPARLLSPGTLLVALYGATLGRLGILMETSATNQACAALQPHDPSGATARYVFHYLRWQRGTLKQMGRGGAQRNLSIRGLRSLACPLPPEAERQRLTQRLDGLMEDTSRARTSMGRASTLLDELQRDVLMAAFPAAGQGTHPGWSTWSFSELFIDRTDRQRRLPREGYEVSGDLPVIDQGASEIGGFTNRHDLAYEGSLPCVVFGDHTRRVKYVTTPFVQGAEGIRVLAPTKRLDPRFAYWLLRAQELPKRTYGRHMKLLRGRSFSVPGKAEQRRIVARIEAALAQVDDLKRTTSDLCRQVADLEEIILSRTFHGRLAPDEVSGSRQSRPAEAAPAEALERHTS